MPGNEVRERVHNFFAQDSLSQGQHHSPVVDGNSPALSNVLGVGSQRQTGGLSSNAYNLQNCDTTRGRSSCPFNVQRGVDSAQSTPWAEFAKSQQPNSNGIMYGNQYYQTRQDESSFLAVNTGSNQSTLAISSTIPVTTMESKVLSIAPAPSPTPFAFPAPSDEATDWNLQTPAAKSPAPSTPLSAQEVRRWRPAAQRNLRNQWSKLASLRTQWLSLSSTARSYATYVVNSYLSQRYMDAMELGILKEMPDIRKKACRKLFKQQEINRSRLLSSYKDMVAVVTQMVYVSKSMRCYLKGTCGSPLTEFSCFPGNRNDAGDCDGIPVFTFWSIFDFEKLAEELVQMFVSETIIKRLLVMEICSIDSEDFSQVDRLKWNDHFYVGEFDDLRICNSNYNEVFKQLVPRVESCNSQSTTMQSSSQLERNVLQVYLTTWLAEVNVDRFRIGELFAMVGEEMHVTIS